MIAILETLITWVIFAALVFIIVAIPVMIITIVIQVLDGIITEYF